MFGLTLGDLTIIALTLAFIAFLVMEFQNSFQVAPNDVERIVLKNIYTGEMRVIGPGASFEDPEWAHFETVALNREPMQIPPEGKPDSEGEAFRTANGARGRISYRYDIIAGRESDETGKLKTDPHFDDAAQAVTNDAVIRAVTKIEYGQRRRRVGEVVKGAVESVLGDFTSYQLFEPSEFKDAQSNHGFRIPNFDPADTTSEQYEFWKKKYKIEPKIVMTADEMYRALAKCIEALSNRGLLFTGFNIVDLKITNIGPESEKLQTSIELRESAPRTAEAAENARTKMKDAISPQEAAVLTDPAAFAEVTKARAYSDIAEALSNLGKSIAEGLKNFGKGP